MWIGPMLGILIGAAMAMATATAGQARTSEHRSGLENAILSCTGCRSGPHSFTIQGN